jgi:hypothetical protein
MKIDYANNLWPPITGTTAAPILSTLHDLMEMIGLQINKQNFFSRRQPEPKNQADVEIIESAD